MSSDQNQNREDQYLLHKATRHARKTGDDGFRLRRAARHGIVSEVRLLLQGGVTTLARGSVTGWTAMHEACRCEEVEVLKELLLLGVDIEVDVQDKTGRSPLFLACEKINNNNNKVAQEEIVQKELLPRDLLYNYGMPLGARNCVFPPCYDEEIIRATRF
jgi:ankyrin repeat protein